MADHLAAARHKGGRIRRNPWAEKIGRGGRIKSESAGASARNTQQLGPLLLLPGQAHDTKGVAPLIHDVSFGALMAGKAFDANWLLEELDERGASAVITPKTHRKQQRDYDADAYKWRHLVENYLAKIKEFRGIATRYDKTDCSYTASWHLAAALIASK